MNYEKKYKEALEKARQFSERPLEEDSSSIVEYIFPELKESEDERIRKALIRFHKSTIDVDGIKSEDIIAWLEKQGEKNGWSEEDEMIALSIKQIVNCASFLNVVPETLDKIDKWLNSLKQRIKEKPEPVEFKWSADDKNKLLIIEQILNCANLLISSQELTEIKNWLKSLKQRIGE